MTIEKIRKNKPDGATHYRSKMLTSGYIYYKPCDAGLLMWSNKVNDWVETFNTLDNTDIKPL